jgi:cytoskeletal protein CcmA (bactofilin family)
MSLFGNRTAKNDATDEGAQTKPEGSGAAKGAGAKDESRTSRSRGFGRTEEKQDGGSPSSRGNSVATIGKSIIFKGELTGSEDLEVNGTVEGDVKLPDHTLTIGQTGQVKASVSAKSILIVGRVNGDVTATERIQLEASGIVDGDLRAPKLLVQEGAVMNGTVEMTTRPAEATKASGTSASRTSSAASESNPASPPAN